MTAPRSLPVQVQIRNIPYYTYISLVAGSVPVIGYVGLLFVVHDPCTRGAGLFGGEGD
jgi:hypothetical protein